MRGWIKLALLFIYLASFHGYYRERIDALGLGLPLLHVAQAHKEMAHNEALMLVDLLLLLAGRWLMPWTTASTLKRRTPAPKSTEQATS